MILLIHEVFIFEICFKTFPDIIHICHFLVDSFVKKKRKKVNL